MFASKTKLCVSFSGAMNWKRHSIPLESSAIALFSKNCRRSTAVPERLPTPTTPRSRSATNGAAYRKEPLYPLSSGRATPGAWRLCISQTANIRNIRRKPLRFPKKLSVSLGEGATNETTPCLILCRLRQILRTYRSTAVSPGGTSDSLQRNRQRRCGSLTAHRVFLNGRTLTRNNGMCVYNQCTLILNSSPSLA